MKAELQTALDNTETAYSDLVSIANEIINEYSRDVNNIISNVKNNVEDLSNDDIRNVMFRLSMLSYSFGDIKEKSSLKARCAEILKEEAYAKKFNEIDGSVALRENTALLETSNEILAQAVYDLIASLFKVKLDEIHRVVDTLKTILTSRLQEARLNTSIDNKAFD